MSAMRSAEDDVAPGGGGDSDTRVSELPAPPRPGLPREEEPTLRGLRAPWSSEVGGREGRRERRLLPSVDVLRAALAAPEEEERPSRRPDVSRVSAAGAPLDDEPA